MTDHDRRRVLALGGTALTVAFAGCSAFQDTKGVPGRDDAGDDSEDGTDSAPVGPSA